MADRDNLQHIILVVSTVVISLHIVLSVPVSIENNGRNLLRSGNSPHHKSWDNRPTTNLLHSQQQQQAQASLEPIFARRENYTGDHIATISSTSGDGSNGDDEYGGGDGDGANANGTFSNDTQVGSRLRQNETEPCSLEPNILCSDPTYSNRDKQQRIAHIVTYLWANLFGNRTRPVNKEMVRERFAPGNPSSSSSFSGDLESIAVSCDLPPQVESEAWITDQFFNLYFNLTPKYPVVLGLNENSATDQDEQQSQDEQHSVESGQLNEFPLVTGSRPVFTTISVPASKGKSVNVISAKLRLYKIGSTERDNVPAYAAIVPPEPCNDTEPTLGLDEAVPNDLPITQTLSPRADEKIRVSIFWYTQPATKNHYKKKLLDAKMLSLGESQWIEFDIKKAVTAWLNDRKPNYGIVVEVENENQDVLDPKKYFRSVPCSKTSSSSRELIHQNDENRDEQDGSDPAGGKISIPTSPMIEICTLNVPDTTTNFERAKMFPYSINMNSLNHLQRVADSHARSSNRNGSAQTRSPWQNINLRVVSPEEFGITSPIGNERRNGTSNSDQRPISTVIVPNHRHRHHHGSQNVNGDNTSGSSDHSSSSQTQRNKPRGSSSSQVFLDEDHPLRDILAAVNANSKEYNKRGSTTSGSHRFYDSFPKGFPTRNSEMPADEGKTESDYLDSTEHEGDVLITKIVMTPAQLKENVLNGGGIFPFPTPMSSTSPTDSTSTGSLSER